MKNTVSKHSILLRPVRGERSKGDEGFILVITLLILVVLSIIAISATDQTEIELKIAGNDRLHKEAFYLADGGTEIGLRLIYDNAICSVTSGGFSGDYGPGSNYRLIGENVVVENLTFSQVTAATLPTIAPADGVGNRHLVYYPDVDLTAAGAGAHTTYDTSPNTNIQVRGKTGAATGSALQMVSGYEGLGASSAAGGTKKTFSIGAQHEGMSNSKSLVIVEWQMSTHILNNASSFDCKY